MPRHELREAVRTAMIGLPKSRPSCPWRATGRARPPCCGRGWWCGNDRRACDGPLERGVDIATRPERNSADRAARLKRKCVRRRGGHYDRTAPHPLPEDLGRACRPPARRRHQPALYRPPPRPRGHQPAGVRRPARRRPPHTPARPDAGGARPQSADHGEGRRARGARLPILDPASAEQLASLERNTAAFGIEYIDDLAAEQGIVHVIGPEQGFTLPGTTLVCGDSHTASHGALGALGFGIGTSEVEHVSPPRRCCSSSPNRSRRASTACSAPASPPRTSRWRSSARWARPAARATSPNIPVRCSARCRSRAG